MAVERVHVSGGIPARNGVHGHAVAQADDEGVLLRRAHTLWSTHLQGNTGKEHFIVQTCHHF